MNSLLNNVALFVVSLVLLFLVDENSTEVASVEWALLAMLFYSAITIFRIILRAEMH